MRIHTTLTAESLASTLGMPDDVTIHVAGPYGSRARIGSFASVAYEVTLRGHGKRHKRAPNTRDDSMPGKAATYDDWGLYLADIYGRDEYAHAGPYKGRADFNRKTDNKYS